MNTAVAAPTHLPKGKAFVVLTTPAGIPWGYYVPNGDKMIVKGTSTLLPAAKFRPKPPAPKPEPKPIYADVPRAMNYYGTCPACGISHNYTESHVQFAEGERRVIKCNGCAKLMRPFA